MTEYDLIIQLSKDSTVAYLRAKPKPTYAYTVRVRRMTEDESFELVARHTSLDMATWTSGYETEELFYQIQTESELEAI